MSDVQLGMLAPANADRDATHVAVVPVIAGEDMEPGNHCGIHNGVAVLDPAKNIGIVDPFLRKNVKKGERFFLCLYPRTVTGLRHHYAHPVLDGDSAATSRDWIEKWAASQAIGYHELMEHAKIWVVNFDYDSSPYGGSNYWCEGGRFEGQLLPSEFWEHYDRVTNTKTPQKARRSFFTCSC